MRSIKFLSDVHIDGSIASAGEFYMFPKRFTQFSYIRPRNEFTTGQLDNILESGSPLNCRVTLTISMISNKLTVT